MAVVLRDGCAASFWHVTAPTALTIDAGGKPLILFTTRNLQTCWATVTEKLRYVRYFEVGTSGGGTPSPTPFPSNLTERLYLPTLRR